MTRYTRMVERHRVPVVMCTWKRIERLPETLRMLGEQTAPASLYVWNNNPREAERLDSLLTRSPVPAESVHSVRNIGSFGRFYLARELAEAHEVVLFVDDDQEFGPSMVSDQLDSFAPMTLAGWWAFTYRPGARSWAERDRVLSPFDRADYVGVGGMVADAEIFRDAGLFGCPRRYWFIDDIWLSYFATRVRGWSLRRSTADFSFVSDGRDLDVTLVMAKIRMFRYLKRRGWQVAGAKPS
jgi:hypothetical protein